MANPDNHRDEAERDFETVASLLRQGDSDGLVAHLQQGAEAEAEAMMRAAGLTGVRSPNRDQGESA